jgi:hypothetical protein
MILKILQILKSFLKRFAEIISLHLTIFNSVLYSIVFAKEYVLIFTKLIECWKLFEWVLFGIWRGHYWLRGVNFQRLLHACLILACVRWNSLLFNVHNLIIFKNCLSSKLSTLQPLTEFFVLKRQHALILGWFVFSRGGPLYDTCTCLVAIFQKGLYDP